MSLQRQRPLLIIIALLPISIYAESQCVTYGSVNVTTGFFLTKTKSYNKIFNGPPKAVNDNDAISVLEDICPDLVEDQNAVVCCGSDQIYNLQKIVNSLKSTFPDDCPSCYHNYRKVFCHLTCSPSQSDFIEVEKSESLYTDEYVSSLKFHVSTKFAQGLYDSCKDVSMPNSEVNVVNAICSSYGNCSPKKLIETISDHLPYSINFEFWNGVIKSKSGKYTPFNEKIVPCYEEINGVSCPCKDCKGACEEEPLPPLLLASSSGEAKKIEEGKCITYGSESIKGASFFSSSKLLNEVYDGRPKPLEDNEAIAILKELCPDLAKDPRPLTCCNKKQLLDLKKNMGTLVRNALGDCPSCYHNYKQTFCQLTCSPYQNKFLEVIKTEEHNSKEFVSELNYYISNKFTSGLFNSCKNVEIPGSATNVLLAMCIPHGLNCNPQRLLNTAAGYSPFKLSFKYSDNTVKKNDSVYIPMNEKAISCSDPVDGVSCSCRDCPQVCQVYPPYPPEPLPWLIGGRDGMVMLSIIIYALFFLTVLAVVVYYVCWVRRNGAEEHRNHLPITIAGCDLGYMEEVEPLKSRHSQMPQSEESSTAAGTPVTPDTEFIIEDNIGLLERLGASLETFLHTKFNKWGVICASYPYLVIFAGLFVSAIFSIGCIKFKVETDPVELWASPQSRSRIERDYYNEHFQPFFRTEQMIILPKNDSEFIKDGKTYGPVLHQEFLLEVLKLQSTLENLTAKLDNGSVVTLQDICHRPMYPVSKACTIQTILNYYQNNVNELIKENYLTKLMDCSKNFLEPQCLGSYGGPIEPHMTLGGYSNESYNLAKALVITFVVKNSNDKAHIEKAEAWEKAFIDHLTNYSNPMMKISYRSERSIQDELDRNSKGDIVTVLVSYVIMFVYISISLGKAKTCSRLFVDSKITLGLSGVLIVIISALASVGIFSVLEIPATLIIIEVIPFLVLAVGVDNIFILVQAFQRDERGPNETLESQIGRIVGDVGPSMLLSSVSESCCFFLGALSDMPAVRIFALYAGTALIFDFLLQISCFISLLVLDAKRQEENRLDVCFCIRANIKQKDANGGANDGVLYSAFKNFYAPFLMKFQVRATVMLIFAAWACSSIAVVDKVEIGLDQELAMPEDSFMIDYFTNLRKYLSVGPPVYFVISDGFNYSTIKNQNMICSSEVKCDWDSLLAQINVAAKRSNRSYIAKPAYSWLDSYFNFMKGPCCKSIKTQNSSISAVAECGQRPVNKVFDHYISNFLREIPSKYCSAGGKALYDDLVETVGKENRIGATAFMSYHTVLQTSKDFYEALRWARSIADNMTEHLREGSGDSEVKVFPYSFFYVFYEQYLTTWPDVLKSLGISVLTIWIVTFLLLGLDFMSATVIVITIILILLNLLGLMYWWGIALNAVALVNLVMAVGISVEFCAHITKSFAASVKATRVLRAEESLINMGSSVLSGITFTKFGGIVVLGFAKSQIFKIYYFQLYLCIVLFGAAHGLIFLPVFLSIAGPSLNKKKLKDHQENKQMEMRLNTESASLKGEEPENSNDCTHM